MNRREPGAAHQALISELQGTLKRFRDSGMPVVEQVAVLAQLVGQAIADLEPGEFSASDVMAAVSGNIVAGNRQAAGDGSVPFIGAN